MGDAETERLWLRRWGPQHDAGLAALNAEPEVMRFLNGGRPLRRMESDFVSERIAEHWRTYGFGLWAAIEKATDRMIGFAGVCHPLWFPEWAGTVEVGWRFHPDAWGRGLATEAGRAALRAGFEERGLESIVAFVHPDNTRSLAVVERLGMRWDQELDHPEAGHRLRVFRADRIVRSEQDHGGPGKDLDA
jgi:RimJ/RimL family protein N-acetyltransferase